MKSLNLAIAVSLLATVSANAANTALLQHNPPASAIVDTCQDRTSLDGLVCLGFVSGVIEGMRDGSTWEAIVLAKAYPKLAPEILTSFLNPCIPAGATNTEIVKVILKYLDNHPERLHNPATGEIYLALNDAWGIEGGPRCQ
jgi:hypothetical protein